MYSVETDVMEADVSSVETPSYTDPAVKEEHLKASAESTLRAMVRPSVPRCRDEPYVLSRCGTQKIYDDKGNVVSHSD
jgi:hypothetical protein